MVKHDASASDLLIIYSAGLQGRYVCIINARVCWGADFAILISVCIRTYYLVKSKETTAQRDSDAAGRRQAHMHNDVHSFIVLHCMLLVLVVFEYAYTVFEYSVCSLCIIFE